MPQVFHKHSCITPGDIKPRETADRSRGKYKFNILAWVKLGSFEEVQPLLLAPCRCYSKITLRSQPSPGEDHPLQCPLNREMERVSLCTLCPPLISFHALLPPHFSLCPSISVCSPLSLCASLFWTAVTTSLSAPWFLTRPLYLCPSTSDNSPLLFWLCSSSLTCPFILYCASSLLTVPSHLWHATNLWQHHPSLILLPISNPALWFLTMPFYFLPRLSSEWSLHFWLCPQFRSMLPNFWPCLSLCFSISDCASWLSLHPHL